ncbi:hypothetical protein [Bacillus sp. CHD6a]|uniref:hypothetical protein n=1 Tax=Bacillus sp. CHD6a TaxID=1643452 RepID=UPI0006CDA5F2|nr:hypothetical protein [Bacillus sp. CHD6a]KPB03693.1 hypothetical protein AAV98_16035 [Bacillus sp. CHD6a]
MVDKKFLEELEEFIWQHRIYDVRGKEDYICYNESPILHEKSDIFEIEEFIKNNKKPTLQQVLFHYMDRHGGTDAEIYKKAGLDRKHFSKIRTNPDYRPKKATMVALAFALGLDEKETEDLLGAAGLSLSENDISDLVIKFFLMKGIYDLGRLNEAVDEMKLRV